MNIVCVNIYVQKRKPLYIYTYIYIYTQSVNHASGVAIGSHGLCRKMATSTVEQKRTRVTKNKRQKNKRERKRKNIRQAEDEQLERDAEIWIHEFEEELVDANDDQAHFDNIGHKFNKRLVFLKQNICSRHV